MRDTRGRAAGAPSRGRGDVPLARYSSAGGGDSGRRHPRTAPHGVPSDRRRARGCDDRSADAMGRDRLVRCLRPDLRRDRRVGPGPLAATRLPGRDRDVPVAGGPRRSPLARAVRRRRGPTDEVNDASVHRGDTGDARDGRRALWHLVGARRPRRRTAGGRTDAGRHGLGPPRTGERCLAGRLRGVPPTLQRPATGGAR
jgi:hypothetical protein